MYMLGDTLVAIDYDLKTIKPLLAKSWTVSPDGKLYTFKLRDDVTFCSGKKFTAEDVVYTVKRVLDKDIKSPFAWRMGKVKDIRAPDPYTVEYELEVPFNELLQNLAIFQATILNKENVESLGKDFGVKGFDGTGPYCWQSWEPRNQTVLTRHAAYKWGPAFYENKGPAKYQRVVMKVVPEEAARLAAMASGQMDICTFMPDQYLPQVAKMPNLQLLRPTAELRLFYLGLKTTRENLTDVRVRTALNLAVDRKPIVDGVYFGNGEPAATYIHPKTPDFDPNVSQHLGKYDPVASRQAARRGGLEDGSRQLPLQGRQEAHPAALWLCRRPLAEGRRGGAGLLAQDRRRPAAADVGRHHRVLEARPAGLRHLVDRLSVCQRRRRHAALLPFQQRADAEPHELEGSGDRPADSRKARRR